VFDARTPSAASIKDKRLIINADDYGLCTEVNSAVEQLIGAGRLRSVSMLANFSSFDECAHFLISKPSVSAGVHLNIIEGRPVSAASMIKPLLDSDGAFVSLNRVLSRWFTRPVIVEDAIEREWSAQLELVLASGLPISHLDSHQHIHAFPPFWRIAQRLCHSYDIKGLRFPFERNSKGRRIAGFALRNIARYSRSMYSGSSAVLNDHFLGFTRVGHYSTKELIADLSDLADGVTELCIHPSTKDASPYAGINGLAEFDAILSDDVWKHICEMNIESVNWANI
jgi:predicted glycoside hydrolase/deacetylase ChbG (UPF0249 family)